MRHLRSYTLLLAGLTLASPAVHAQPAPTPPPNAQKGDAKELMRLGVKLLTSKDYLGALAVFKDAYVRFPSAKILLNIGTTLKLLERNADAVNAYQRYLDSPDTDPSRQADVTREIERLEQTLARLEITAPPEAELQIGSDDWVPAAVGRNYRVNPGAYIVRARRPGYKPFETTGEVALGQQATVAVELEKVPAIVKQVFITTPGLIARPRSRLGALALGHFDVQGGAAGLVGATFDLTRRIQVRAAGIVGANFGMFAGVNVALLTGTLRPIVSAGIPLFFNDGARIGVRGAAGLEIVANRHFALIIELGVEHNLNPQDSVEFGGMLRSINATSFIPALGATARL